VDRTVAGIGWLQGLGSIPRYYPPLLTQETLMNGRAAHMLRDLGLTTKKDKRWFKSLSHIEKGKFRKESEKKAK
jgi:hypothetical protein